MFPGVGVVRMDLNAQIVPGVNDLYQQGEYLLSGVSKQLRMVFPEPAQGFALEGAVFDGTVAVFMGADYPGLSGVVAGDGVTVLCAQAGTAPEHLLEYRLKKNQFSHICSPCGLISTFHYSGIRGKCNRFQKKAGKKVRQGKNRGKWRKIQSPIWMPVAMGNGAPMAWKCQAQERFARRGTAVCGRRVFLRIGNGSVIKRNTCRRERIPGDRHFSVSGQPRSGASVRCCAHLLQLALRIVHRFCGR